MNKLISLGGKTVWRVLVPRGTGGEWSSSGCGGWYSAGGGGGGGGARRGLRVGLVGAGSAAAAAGRPLGMLLRAEPGVSALVGAERAGAAAAALQDLAHVPAPGALRVNSSLERLDTALADTDLVLLVGATLTPALPPPEQLRLNSAFLKSVLSQIVRIVPMPFIGFLMEPMNKLFPMALELTKARNLSDTKKMFGITTLNALRAEALFASIYGLPPEKCRVPVIGGCSGPTAVPIFSHATPRVTMDEDIRKTMTNEFRCLEDKIFNAKHGYSSNLSTAFAALAFTRSIKQVVDDNRTVEVSAMVENNDLGTGYLAGRVTVSMAGAGPMECYDKLTPFECDMLELSLRQLRSEIASATDLTTISS